MDLNDLVDASRKALRTFNNGDHKEALVEIKKIYESADFTAAELEDLIAEKK
jgi:hypothetical protein